MKSEFTRLLLGLLVLIAGGAAEDLLPKVFGAGLPLLLALAVMVATRWTALETVLFAVTAGALEDALSGLPPAMSVSFFLAAAVLSRQAVMPRSVTVLSYAAYQLWLSLWLSLPVSVLFSRMLLAVPLGLLAMAAAELSLRYLERKAAVDEG